MQSCAKGLKNFVRKRILWPTLWCGQVIVWCGYEHLICAFVTLQTSVRISRAAQNGLPLMWWCNSLMWLWTFDVHIEQSFARTLWPAQTGLPFDVAMNFLMWVIVTHTTDLCKDFVASFLSTNQPTNWCSENLLRRKMSLTWAHTNTH